MTELLIVAGTRPEAIKMAPVIDQLQKLRVDFRLVWSGQHYDHEMSRAFFEQLDLPKPDDNLNIGSGTNAEVTAGAMVALEKIIRRYEPCMVISEGDTNTVAAAAMTSANYSIPFAHVEAGLRSWNMLMPEETNRKIADSIASLHFAPTRLAALNLLFEGVSTKGLHVTGNTIVDIVHKHAGTATNIGGSLLAELNLERNKYLLATVHRAENTDAPARLRSILIAINKLAGEFDVVFPMHPRTGERIARLGLGSMLEGVVRLKPLGYWEFLGLLMNCSLVLTDSGGVQEEACVLRIPTVTLRYNTERPETLMHGNVLAGAETQSIVECVQQQIESAAKIRKSYLRNPFGDGHAGEKIANFVKESIEEGLAIEEPDLRRSPFMTYGLSDHRQMTWENNVEGLVGFDDSGLPYLPSEVEDLSVRWLLRIRRSYDPNLAEFEGLEKHAVPATMKKNEPTGTSARATL